MRDIKDIPFRRGADLLKVVTWALVAAVLVPDPVVAQSDVAQFQGYEHAPPFSVVSREEKLTFYPCDTCHNLIPVNPTPRKLEASPHQIEFNHGGGRFWCLSCHHTDERNHLRTLDGARKLEFDEAYLVCGQCHANRQKDWYFGAHGKRVANWHGERQLHNCTHCHDAHDPRIKPRKPQPPPPVRSGLSRVPGETHRAGRVWEQDGSSD